ncbi:alpha/beta hydrolase [Niabella ginsenosidivorans]|uniref:Alpha/beta hydrolase n=1 Tax=Niabella ginsenosidivorans TaxID=1176587 RepID=A0A1A9I914_9BACT|nr:alpha/beta hydrolase [Niabella ginsenosidivorans]
MISYCTSGSGKHPVICLHGFNESAHSFAVLQNPANCYTLIAMDAPFHGNTQWKQGLRFTPVNLHEIIHAILETEGFTAKTPFSLVGFSLGGRLALAYYEKYPVAVKQLLLLAPDGLKFNCWYWCAAHTFIGNKLFAFTMKHPRWFIQLAGLLNRLGFINTGIKKFVAHYLDDERIRERLYNVWTAFRYFKPGIAQIKKSILLHQTPARLYFGKYDTVIPPERGTDFVKGAGAYAQTHTVEAGHRLLQNKEVQAILKEGF